MNQKFKGLYILERNHYEAIYPADIRGKISEYADIYAPLMDRKEAEKRSDVLKEAQVIFSGWGAPVLDEVFLQACPELEAFFYGSGSVKNVATDSFWERSIVLTNARAANAIAVAEFTISQILFGLKHGWQLVREIRRDKGWSEEEKRTTTLPGNCGTTVGLISLGAVARCVLEKLVHYEHKRLVCDPFATEEEIRRFGSAPASLDEIFEKSDFVSLHTPLLPETRGMIRGTHFEVLKAGATFLNTARGAVINEPEMIDVLQSRPDVTAILDVTVSEPPPPDSPLYTMDNVVLTPHLAGVHQAECRRMGALMAEELRRYVENQPLQWAVTKETLAAMA
jgi:phosphoglycerate dehydrogenase-like enzyme